VTKDVAESHAHWIGIEKGWEEVSPLPWSHLVSLPASRLRTHALLIGATGSGKTNLLHHLIAQDILLGHSFAVLDLRGDLIDAALDMLHGWLLPYNIFLLDLREKQFPAAFDPLHGSGESYFRALNVLDVVASESESWGVQLAETLRNALMLLAECGEPLTCLESIFFDPAYVPRLLKHFPKTTVGAFWRRFADLPADRKTALASPVVNKMSLLMSTATVRRILGHPRPMNLRGHLDTKSSVTLISLAGDELHSAGRMMGRIVLSSICREIFARVDTIEALRNPVRLYVDEFEHFGTSDFEAILAEGRKFGLSIVLAHQTLAQLSPKLRSMILNNVGTKVVFRCGREDAKVLSADLTGDPKALDLANLKTGEAVLWTKEDGQKAIEVNEPIVRHRGTRSRAAQHLARAIQEAHGLSVPIPDPFLMGGSRLPVEPETVTPIRVKPSPKTELEDWLCN